MTVPRELHSATIDQIRAWRRVRLPLSAIVQRLLPARQRLDITAHLRAAFCTRQLIDLEFVPADAHGIPRADAVDRVYEPHVEEARAMWHDAPPYPDLYRRRDRHSFREVARTRRAYILVTAVETKTARFIGRDGYRPWPSCLHAFPRVTAPNTGLLAADPIDPRIEPPYDEFRLRLLAAGYRISSEDSGYLVRDESNCAFYPAYRVLGLWSDSGQNLLNSAAGEEMRSELNLRLGEELVQFAPDLFESDLPGPQSFVPILIFEPEGNVTVRDSPDSMRAYCRFRSLPLPRPQEKLT